MVTIFVPAVDLFVQDTLDFWSIYRALFPGSLTYRDLHKRSGKERYDTLCIKPFFQPFFYTERSIGLHDEYVWRWRFYTTQAKALVARFLHDDVWCLELSMSISSPRHRIC